MEKDKKAAKTTSIQQLEPHYRLQYHEFCILDRMFYPRPHCTKDGIPLTLTHTTAMLEDLNRLGVPAELQFRDRYLQLLRDILRVHRTLIN